MNKIPTYQISVGTTCLKISVKSAVALLWFLLLAHKAVGQVRDADHQQTVVEQINALYAAGQWEAGKEMARSELQKSPHNADLKMLLGKYYLHQKDYDQARFELYKSLELDPEQTDARHLMVTVESETGRYSSAICYVNELLEVQPYWKGLWRQKIELYRLQGNTIEANRLRERIRHIFPDDAQLKQDYVYYTEQQAHAYRKDGHLEKARELSRTLIQENPENIQHYLQAANDYLQSGEPHMALSFVERGLERFPENEALIDKKAGILYDQYRHAELLDFLQQKNRRQQYQYYLLQVARSARDQDPATLYGKVFLDNPASSEAFTQVFNQALATHQYEQALMAISRHRNATGASKELLAKELLVYRRMGNSSRANALVIELFHQYPDADVTEDYVLLMLSRAQDKMAQKRYREAIGDWEQVKSYGSPELSRLAAESIATGYHLSGRHHQALEALDPLLLQEPENPDLHVKQAKIYLELHQYQQAFSAYRKAYLLATPQEKWRFLGGFADMASTVIHQLSQEHRYREALRFVEQWLEVDPDHYLGLHYGVNLAHQIGDTDRMRAYTRQGLLHHPGEVFFKVKMAELEGEGADLEAFESIYTNLHAELLEAPYQPSLRDVFSQTTQQYGLALIKDQQSQVALQKIDTALVYAPTDSSLKHLKGVALERLHQFDSAHYYQSFYQASAIEAASFKQHLNYLQYRAGKNQIGINHLRSRFGDQDRLQSISGLEYTRFEGRNTYSARIHYTGREPGKGLQIQGEWLRDWSEKYASRINVAWASQFFPQLVANASLLRYLDVLGGLELELGGGYRKLWQETGQLIRTDGNMYNLVVGGALDQEKLRLNPRLQVFMLDENLLYNLSINTRYYLSTPRNYLMAVGSIGSSPDVDLVDYQLHREFSVLNTMVGAGAAHLISSQASVSLLGTWYHYQASQSASPTFRNLYNLQIQLHVSF